jgi:hypothetical protein
MKFSVIPLILSFVVAAPVLGGPGDLRLLQGKLEWPTALSGSEPFIVLRGDDGRVYYADVVGAQRYVQGALSAGSQIALLGLEGTKPHEVDAVALGSGDTAALSVALAQVTPTTSLRPVVIEQPPVSAQRPSALPGEGYWHYCDSAKGYYPSVPSCREPWILVPPRRPAR